MPTSSGYDPSQPIGVPYGRSGPAVLPGAPSSPFNTGPQSPYGVGSPLGVSPFSSAQQSALQNALSAAGIWDTIKGLGGDVWGAINKILPHVKNPDGTEGGIDWAGALKDVGSWVKNNKDTILQGLAAYNNYQRSQKSDEYAQQALAGAKEAYAAKEPLRVVGQAGLLNPQANAPDLSGLKTQGQAGLQLAAPQPLPLATGNLENAQRLAAGPMSSNPFTKTLPLATAPTPPTVPAPALRKIRPLSVATA